MVHKLSPLLLLALINQIAGDCGQPGQSVQTRLLYDSDFTSETVAVKSYPENAGIQYGCNKDTDLVVGTGRRTCKSNKWTGSVPKCASWTLSNLTYDTETFSVSMFTRTVSKLTGFQLDVETKDDLKILSAKNLPDFKCYRDQLENSGSDYNLYTLTCVTTRVSMATYDSRNWLGAVFSQEVRCRTACRTKIIEARVYELVNDDCNLPDQPRYGTSKLLLQEDNGGRYDRPTTQPSLTYPTPGGRSRRTTPLKASLPVIVTRETDKLPNVPDSRGRSPSTNVRVINITHKYECDEYFAPLDTSRPFIAFCPPRGDWRIRPRIPTCKPTLKTCPLFVLDEDVITVNYTDLWEGRSSITGGFAAFDCVDSSKRTRTDKQLECLQDGNWTGKVPKCIPRPSLSAHPSSDSTNATTGGATGTFSLAMVGTLVVGLSVFFALVFGIIWYRKKSSDATNIAAMKSSNMTSTIDLSGMKPRMRLDLPEFEGEAGSRYTDLYSESTPPIYDEVYASVRTDALESIRGSAYYVQMNGREAQVRLHTVRE